MTASGRGWGVPWCDTCDRYYNPDSLTPDGDCATCGTHIADPDEEQAKDSKPPWHFWLLVVALVIYLGWRLVQLIMWLIR